MIKKLSIILLFALFTNVSYGCSVIQPDSYSYAKHKKGKRKKNGRYKKKKGLFGKKKDCGCPKH